MNDHIPKPVDPDHLYEAIRKWFGKQEAGQEEESASAQEPQPALEQEAPLAAEASSEFQYLDVEQGIARVAGNQELYHRLLTRFAGEQADSVREIQAAVEANDREQAKSLCHKLKGVAGNLSATELFPLAAELDHDLVNSIPDDAMQRLEKLQQAFDSVVSEIPKVASLIGVDQPAEEGQSEADSGGAILPRLESLEALLQADDYDAHQSLRGILETLPPGPQRESLESVRSSLDQYDFESALTAVRALISKLNQ